MPGRSVYWCASLACLHSASVKPGAQVYAALANALPFEEDEKEDLRERMKKREPDMMCVVLPLLSSGHALAEFVHRLLHNLGVSEAGQDFVERLMTFDPKFRMTAGASVRD